MNEKQGNIQGRTDLKKDSKKVKKTSKKVLTNLWNGVIISKLTRESAAPNLENDTETTTQKKEDSNSE